MRILIVDDERQITRVLRTSLQSSGYEVTVANNGLEAFELFSSVSPDLVITDLAMPEMDGIELTRAIRRTAETPIIVLSVREQETMKVAALDEGADDYVTKPFSMPELLARVRANLRKIAREEPAPAQVTVGDLYIDTSSRAVRVRGSDVHLTPKEFDLLLLFVNNPNRVLTHKFLLRQIWGTAGEDQPEYLRVLIAQLRKKLDPADSSRYIESEPWVGYRLRIRTYNFLTTSLRTSYPPPRSTSFGSTYRGLVMSLTFLKIQSTLSLLLVTSVLAPAALRAQATDTPAADPATTSTSTQTPSAPAPVTPTPPALDQSFLHRLGRAYVADWAGNGPASAVPETRRGTPAPITSPPFPSSDWPIGGTPTIGTADGQTYPLMQAIDQNKSQNKIYGWIEVGANGSTNNKTNAGKGIPANFPSAYDEYSNTVQLDQAALYFDRIPNTTQTDHFDWGYRLALLYGVDYRFTTAHGMFSQQLLVKNTQYGFDPVMFYMDFYVPHVARA